MDEETKETQYLMSIPGFFESIQQANKEIARGEFVEMSEVFTEE